MLAKIDSPAIVMHLNEFHDEHYGLLYPTNDATDERKNDGICGLHEKLSEEGEDEEE